MEGPERKKVPHRFQRVGEVGRFLGKNEMFKEILYN